MSATTRAKENKYYILFGESLDGRHKTKHCMEIVAPHNQTQVISIDLHFFSKIHNAPLLLRFYLETDTIIIIITARSYL